LRNEKITSKIREHSLAKSPVILALGKRETSDVTVSMRKLGSQEQSVMPLAQAIAELSSGNA
jgi:threonyl-tRNA synthetase